MKRNPNTKTKLAALLSGLAHRLDPQSCQNYSFSIEPEEYYFLEKTKPIQRVTTKISYSREYLDGEQEQLEKNYIIPQIAENIAKELLKSGHIEIQRTNDSYSHHWLATLYVVKM